MNNDELVAEVADTMMEQWEGLRRELSHYQKGRNTTLARGLES